MQNQFKSSQMKRNLHNTQFNISSLEQGSDEPIDDIAGCFFIMAISFYKTEVHEINDVRLKQMFMIERDHDAAWGCYKKIINLLYENDGYFVNDCKKIAYFINSPLKRVERIVNDYGLFTYHLQNDIEMISNHSVNANYEKIIEKSVKASESAKKRWENDANAMRTQCERNAINNLQFTINNLQSKKEEEKKISSSDELVAKKISDKLYPQIISVWDEFLKTKDITRPEFSKRMGAAFKNIIKHLLKTAENIPEPEVDEFCINSFRALYSKYDSMSKYHRECLVNIGKLTDNVINEMVLNYKIESKASTMQEINDIANQVYGN